MQATWDPKKAESNFKKHKIRFSDAEMVLYDPFAMTLEEQVVAAQQRFVSIGSDAVGRVIVIVYSYRADTIRLISARKATPSERKQYEKGI
ncbi:MAG: BrnT family toxin [Desulfobacterales bacterium]